MSISRPHAIGIRPRSHSFERNEISGPSSQNTCSIPIISTSHRIASHSGSPTLYSNRSCFIYQRTGHGNLTPRTSEGKVVTMLYALVGVPLMLMCLSSLGGFLAEALQCSYGRLCGGSGSKNSGHNDNGGRIIDNGDESDNRNNRHQQHHHHRNHDGSAGGGKRKGNGDDDGTTARKAIHHIHHDHDDNEVSIYTTCLHIFRNRIVCMFYFGITGTYGTVRTRPTAQLRGLKTRRSSVTV